MRNIGIVGSGRWAKEILKILYDIFEDKILINIYTNSNNNHMADWIREKDYKKKDINILSYQNINDNKCDAYIIVNSAKDHFDVSKKIINFKKPLFIEKPICLSMPDVRELIELSQELNVTFGTSNIFLFAKYVLDFKDSLLLSKKIESLDFIWSDASTETRYGEIKTYDPSLPIFKDILPHVLTIIIFLLDSKDIFFKNMCYEDGGSKLKLIFVIQEITCCITLARNNYCRERLINVQGDKFFSLDFSEEPGSMKINGKIKDMNGSWLKSESPATKMLRSYFDSIFSGSYLDERIIPNKDIYKLIDDVNVVYKDERINFIKSKISNGDLECENFQYCMREYLLENSLVKFENIDSKIEDFKSSVRNNSNNFNHILDKELSAFVRMHI